MKIAQLFDYIVLSIQFLPLFNLAYLNRQTYVDEIPNIRIFIS